MEDEEEKSSIDEKVIQAKEEEEKAIEYEIEVISREKKVKQEEIMQSNLIQLEKEDDETNHL